MLAFLPLLIFVAAVVYMWGMDQLEGDPRTFLESIGWAAETLSTTGYGSDVRWSHPLMMTFVVVLQFFGVFLVFLIFPIYLIPFLEERFETRLPREIPKLDGHVVIYRYGPAVETLLAEIDGAGMEAVVLDSEESTARRLIDRGYTVLAASLEDHGLERAHLLEAKALVANGSDDENATLILAARQLGFEGEILALVEEPFHRRPMALAGATAAFTPRHVLGAALAAKASRKVRPTLSGGDLLGRKLRVSEVRIQPDSRLAGRSLGELALGERTGVTVLGFWLGGELHTDPRADTVLPPDSIVIMAGSDESLERFGRVCAGARPLRREGPVVVCGAGEVGKKVVELLREVGEDVVLLDIVEHDGVDVVGDVLDPGVLERARVSDAQAVVLALDTDSATLFGTVILKEIAPGVPVIARVNAAENLERIHRAGAEFAQSISQVSGRILAHRLLGEDAVAVDEDLKLLRVNARGLAGRAPQDLELRERTGCSVVAVERGDELLFHFGGEFRFEDDDTVFVCGSTKATRRFLDVFPQGSGRASGA